MAEPFFVWCDTTGLGRNVFVFFRRSFRLAGDPDQDSLEATLHLFADTRYRLWVNGAIVAYGPARFLPSHPEYDTVDLRPWLKKGFNTLVVEANTFGANNFQAMPSVGGFIAWGEVQTGDGQVDLSTPGEWKMLRTDAWDQEAPAYSFAQAPAEIVDMRVVPAGVHGPAFDDRHWPAPVVVERQDAWGEPAPRSIPMLTMDLYEPEKVLVHSPLADREEVVGARVPGEKPYAGGQRVRCCFGTYIFSPCEQDVTLGAFWGPLFLNGQEIASVRHAVVANRLDYPVWLRAGWNFLYGEPEIVSTRWGILIALPGGRGLVASADRDIDCPETMVFSQAVPEDVLCAARAAGVPTEISQMPVLDVPWHKARRGEPIPLPARLSGWDTPLSRVVEQPSTVRDLCVPAGRDWVVVFDFGKQFMGHIALDVESAPGTILDVAYDERLRADGLAAMFRANPAAVDNADRFVTSGGRERIEGFRSRGARYVQLAVRNAAEPVTLHSVAVRNTLYPMAPEGRFECSDPVLNWTWSAGVETIRITMETVLNADSWRERAMYCNDTVVIYNSLATFWSDPAMIRRCLRLYARSQSPEGLLCGVVPAWWTPGTGAVHFWTALVHDYVQRTADLELLRELWPNVLLALAAPQFTPGPRGLLGDEEQVVWFDQSPTAQSQTGENGVFNAHHYGALRRAADLAGMLNDGEAAAQFRARARRFKRAFQALWDEKTGRYATTLHDGRPDPGPAPHANVLALYYDLAEGDRAQAALAYVEDYLSDEKFLGTAHLELYFHFWALEVLYKHERVELAEHVMRRTWGHMKNAGAWALWEAIWFTQQDTGQLCQGWAAAPLIAMAHRVLGVRPTPGRPQEVLIAPTAATLTYARGAVAHPAGPIEVDWRLHEGAEGRWLELAVSAPRALEVRVAPEGPLAGIPVRATVRKP
ncbi:MAG: hypothetical protein AMK73_00285 [Planctomycetes bacterium SM23_32]|nr:MAG: hypothetical protein AMK73_00285 [Planctomycetes bacterium SM23_32]